MPARRNTTSAGGTGGGVRVDVSVNAQRATDEFRAARRDINARTKDGLRVAGEEVALPAARARAPVKTGRLRNSLIVRARARDAVLTTSLPGRQARYVGLLEFGGTVRAQILPRTKQAVVVNGQPVASVTTPRRYRGRHFLTSAVQDHKPQILDRIETEIMRAFDGFSG